MAFMEKLGLNKGEPLTIDWEMTPADTFGIYESWGTKERIRSMNERCYYFYIDGWHSPAKLYLMERGIRHARILAQIDAPKNLIETCIKNQGQGVLDKSYAIDSALREWLEINVLNNEDSSKIIRVEGAETEELGSGLPLYEDTRPEVEIVRLRSKPAVVNEKEIEKIVKKGSFYDAQYNPSGRFPGCLVDNRDGLTVTDLKTGIMWQLGGCDITTINSVNKYVASLNQQNLAGFSNWRLPTIEEGLSLLVPEENYKYLHIHPCFSRDQAFVFTCDTRKPGGHWFVDFRQATVFWASGIIPGGFGRACRSI